MSSKASLDTYLENIRNNVKTSASEYAKTIETQQYVQKASGLRLVREASSGVQSLEVFASKMKLNNIAASETEVLARSVLTALYGLQCEVGALAAITDAPFEPRMDDPQIREDSTADRLEEALEAVGRMSRVVKFVTAASAMAISLNSRSRSYINKTLEEVDSYMPADSMLKSIDTNDHRAKAIESLEKLMAAVSTT